MTYRSGIGYDAHALVEGHSLALGGISIPFESGLAGHSDGDVLLHAIIDALLGAAVMGDIGTHFPSSNPDYKDIPSVLLLEDTRQMLAEGGWHILHVDATIVAERPRLQPFIDAMREKIAQTLGLDKTAVSVKAKTTDGLGFTGRAEGIATYAIATIQHTA
ncbi:MAG: 2-C-methyl-D-erythritol 2,4-cyclodiphosphate synthase [Chloroflexi bacterium]|nr:2-C-methyl-D-erythritol 2,4-cyclodiphosphate synthase [Chloroflexota bacterium]